MIRDDWDQVLDIRPLETIPQKALGTDIPFLTEWLTHPDKDELWKKSSWKERYQGASVPALILSGWFDDNGMGTTEALDLVKNWPREPGRLFWDHGSTVEMQIMTCTMCSWEKMPFDMIWIWCACCGWSIF